MRIKKLRIRNVTRYLEAIKDGDAFFVGLTSPLDHHTKLKQIGFSNEMVSGEQILPAIHGPVSGFNAEGRYVKQKHLKKETAYRQIEWTWKDWGGYEHSKIVDVPYQRYPVKFVSPPSLEISIVEKDDRKIVVSRKFSKGQGCEEDIKHCINLFLELFGECDILKEDLLPAAGKKVIRLNWTILPPGEYPWERVRQKVKAKIKQAPGGNQPVIQHRIESISRHTPDFVALGNGGFNGYMVFGFSKKNIYVLESIYTGNATYVFDQDWKQLSQLTKREILLDDLHTHRFIHREGWLNHIDNLLVA